MSPRTWQDPDPLELLHLEACKNARLLSRVCDLLGVRPDGPAPVRLGTWQDPCHVDVEGDDTCPPPIDYDPDIHGWPWETDYV